MQTSLHKTVPFAYAVVQMQTTSRPNCKLAAQNAHSAWLSELKQTHMNQLDTQMQVLQNYSSVPKALKGNLWQAQSALVITH